MSTFPGYGRPGEQLRRDEQGRVRDARDRVVAENGARYYPRDYVWSPYQPPEPRPKRNSEPSLWEQAVALWNDLTLGWGHPVDLVRWVYIRALEHRGLGYWLRNLEDVVRRAIRAQARELDLSLIKLPPPRQRPAQPPPAPAEETPRFRAIDRDEPWTWKVCFRMSARWNRKKSARKRPSPRPEPRASRPAIPYAYRIEAVRRILTYPDDYVQRYARRLARRDAAAAAILPPPERGRSDVSEAKSGWGSLGSAGAPPLITPRNAKHEEPG